MDKFKDNAAFSKKKEKNEIKSGLKLLFLKSTDYLYYLIVWKSFFCFCYKKTKKPVFTSSSCCHENVCTFNL